MTPKEISRAAGRVFTSLVPHDWAIRSQEDQEDYGIDYEIELTTPDDQASGVIFKVQQKGAEALKMVDGGSTVTFSGLPVSKMRYYLCQVRIPVVLILVDVSSRAAFWTVLQGNPDIEREYAGAVSSGAGTLSIRVPTVNAFPDTKAELLERVARCVDHLLIKGLQDTTSKRLIEAAEKVIDISRLAGMIGSHHDYVRLEQVEQLIHQGRRDEAFAIVNDLLNSPSENAPMRFAAGLDVIRIRGGIAARDQGAEATEEYMRERWRVSRQLLQLVRGHGSPKHLRAYVMIMLRSSKLRRRAEDDFGLFMSSRVQAESEEPVGRIMTDVARKETAILVAREFAKLQLSLVRLIEKRHIKLLPQAWAMLAMDVLPFVLRLREDGLQDAEQQIVKWMEDVGRVAIQTATAMKQWRDIPLCAIQWLALGDGRDRAAWASRVKLAEEFIGAIPDGEVKNHGLADLEAFAAIPFMPSPTPTVEEEVALIRQMAHSLGIDPDNPKNAVDRVVRIGLDDLNPERVLRHCQHLFVSLGSCGVPGRMLGLPTAGSKYLHCTKHGFSIGGQRLDALAKTLSSQRCRHCPDLQPHPVDWRWTRKWQQEQDRKWHGFAEQ